MEEVIYYILAIPAIIISSAFHEYAHAWTAYRLGDITPKLQDRLTLNPLKHIDPIGAISLILFRFGWSKPVVINPDNFKNPVVGNALVAAAGPVSNLLLIFIAAIPLRILNLILPYDYYITLVELSLPFIIINAALDIFNLFPIPPLDGSRIIKILIPESMHKFWENLDRFGFILVLLFIIPLSPFSNIFNWIMENGILLLIRVFLGV